MPTSTGKATDLITFSRGTLATVTDADGKIKWAPHNLLTNSESFGASSWTKDGGSSVSANTVVAPNGTTTADTFMDSAVSGQQRAYQSVNVVADQIVTFSVYLKNGTRRYARVSLNYTDDATIIADLQSGTITQFNNANWTIYNASITPVGNGWFLVSLTASRVSTTQYYAIIATCNVSSVTGGYSYTGDGSTIYAWGAHLYRSDLAMQANASAYPMYNPTTPKNLLGYSEDFSNAAWSRGNMLAFGSGSVANAVAAPNGSLSADLLVPNTTSGGHDVRNASVLSSLAANNTATLSIYAKAAGYNFIRVQLSGTISTNSMVYFNLASGTEGTKIAGTGTIVSSSITPVGDGWYRCSVTAKPASGDTFVQGIFTISNVDGSATFAGDGTSGVYLWGAQLSDSASLDAYSPVFGAAPSAAAYHGPRLDYDPVTLSARGLLVEEARTNFRTYSSDFTQSSVWTPKASTTVNSTTLLTAAPSGAVTAQAIVPASNGGTNGIADETGLYSTGRVFSFYAKAGSGITVIAGQDGAGNTWTINLSTGAGTFAAAYTYNSVTPVANGWYRVAMNTTGTGTNFYIGANAGADGTNYFYLWGVQLEAGAFATSYIPTAAATVTRNADVASVGVSQFPYSATEGTIVASVDVFSIANPKSANLYSFYVDTSNIVRSWIWDAEPSTPRGTVTTGGSNVAGFAGATVSANTPFKTALAVKANDFGFASNGTSVAPDTSGALPPSSSLMHIGCLGGLADTFLNGHIRQITYIPRRLTSTELAARTA